MYTFRILDKHNKPVPLQILDEEASIFWGRTPNPHRWASPEDSHTSQTWYDIIGNAIIYDHFPACWQNVVYTIAAERLGRQFINGLSISVNPSTIANLKNEAVVIQPYLNLVQFWASKGYQPQRLKL